MEFIDLYDRERKVTDKTIVRGEVIPKDHYIMVIHVCIFSNDGKMLIQQRQDCKKDWPNKWDLTVAGCALTGEKSQDAAMREVYEELGYQVNLVNKRPSLTINFDKGFDDIYLLNIDLDISELIIQLSEVRDVKWATKCEILDMLKNEELIPYHTSLIELLFAMRKYEGVYIKKVSV